MDIITQGLIGAAAAQAGAKTREIKLATLVGFCAPLLADADALIRSSNDPLLFLEYHRYITHSLLFIPVGALIASMLLWPLLRSRLSFKRIYFYAFLGYATAGFLDACTSYGTHLLWPFSNERTAWSIISIFDPVFSLALIVAIVITLSKHRSLAARFGLMFAAAYLLFGFVQHHRAESIAYSQAEQRGHQVKRLIVKPTIGNLLLWRSVYQTQDRFYVDAVRVGLIDKPRVFAGDSVPVFDLQRDLPHLSEAMMVYRDIERFNFFSDGFLAWHPERPDVLGDIRYAMLPTSTRPLWGITLPVDSPGQHVSYNTYRNLSESERKAFIGMLMNQL